MRSLATSSRRTVARTARAPIPDPPSISHCRPLPAAVTPARQSGTHRYPAISSRHYATSPTSHVTAGRSAGMAEVRPVLGGTTTERKPHFKKILVANR